LRNQNNPHHGIYTTLEEYGVPGELPAVQFGKPYVEIKYSTGILIIPRWALAIFYNTHEPNLYMEAYNQLSISE
jgi:hypothetical protein